MLHSCKCGWWYLVRQLTESISMAFLRAWAASSWVTSIKFTPSQTRIWSPTFNLPYLMPQQQSTCIYALQMKASHYLAAAPPSNIREMNMAPPRGVSVPPLMAIFMGPFLGMVWNSTLRPFRIFSLNYCKTKQNNNNKNILGINNVVC